MSTACLVTLLGCLLALAPATAAEEEPVEKVWFPEPTIDELVGLLEKWNGPAKAILVLAEKPKSRLTRYLRWIDGEKLLAKSTAAAKNGEEVPVASILSLTYARFPHRATSQIERAMKAHNYPAAFDLLGKVDQLGDKGKHIHVEQRRSSRPTAPSSPGAPAA